MKGDQIDREGWSVYLKYTKVNQKISFIHLSSLQTAVITADYVIVNPFDRKKKYYNVLPSVAASVYLFCTYLENKIITSDT